MSRRDIGCEAHAVGRRHENKLEGVSFRGAGVKTKGRDVSRTERESVGVCVGVCVCEREHDCLIIYGYVWLCVCLTVCLCNV